VLELDSWQCRGLGEAKISPHISVFTTLYPDHANYYKDNPDLYIADKANIFLNQKTTDVLVVGSQALEVIRAKYPNHSARMVEADMSQLLGWKLKIPGNHNLQNAACAVAATRACGVDEATIRNAVESFSGVPGRLELVRDVEGVKIYNDTTATTLDATYVGMVALAGLAGNTKKIVLIMGGTDKGLPLDVNKFEEINRIANAIILLPGSGTERIKNSIWKRAVSADSLKDAVTEALQMARPEGYILFSPAFASFGMFKNEYDRGDQFKAIVKKL